MIQLHDLYTKLHDENGHDTTLPISGTSTTNQPGTTAASGGAALFAAKFAGAPATNVYNAPANPTPSIANPTPASTPTLIASPTPTQPINQPAASTTASRGSSVSSAASPVLTAQQENEQYAQEMAQVQQGGYGSQLFQQNVTETGPAPGGGTLTQGLSPLYFATQQAAQGLAQQLGGQVQSANPYGSGPVQSNATEYNILINGQSYNAGLLLNELSHGDINAATFANGSNNENGGQ